MCPGNMQESRMRERNNKNTRPYLLISLAGAAVTNHPQETFHGRSKQQRSVQRTHVDSVIVQFKGRRIAFTRMVVEELRHQRARCVLH
jgi:hypothetical protein